MDLLVKWYPAMGAGVDNDTYRRQNAQTSQD